MDETFDRLFASIYQQESGSGKADTTGFNEHGVTGPMQIQQATWDLLVSKKMIPKEWRITDPDQNMKAGRVLLQSLYVKFGKDPAKAAAAYHAGDKAIRPDGSIIDFRDKKNPNYPGTHDYVRKVLGRMGIEPTGLTPVPLMERQAIPAFTPPAPAVIEAEPAPDYATAMAPQRSGISVPDQAGAVAEQQAAREREALATPSFGDVLGASFDYSTVTGAASRAVQRALERNELTADPNYKLDKSILSGLEADEISELMEARSKAEEQMILRNQEDRRKAYETIGSRGVGMALFAGLLAGLPEGMVTGMGVAASLGKAGILSAKLAASGRMAAAAASSFGEQAGLNLAMVGIQEALDRHTTGEDLVIGAALGAVTTGLSLPGLHGVQLKAEGEALRAQAHQSIMDRLETTLKETAASGETVTPERLADILSGKAREEGPTPNPSTRGLKLLQYEDDGVTLKGIEETTAPGAEKAPAKAGTLDQQKEQIRGRATLEELRADLDRLYPEGAKARPEGYASLYPEVWTTDAYSTDDVSRVRRAQTDPGFTRVIDDLTGGLDYDTIDARFGSREGTVHVLKNLEDQFARHPELLQYVETLDRLATKFMPAGHKILLSGRSTPNAQGITVSMGKYHVIGLDAAYAKETLPHVPFITVGVHELGHAIFHAWAKDLPPELISRLKKVHLYAAKRAMGVVDLTKEQASFTETRLNVFEPFHEQQFTRLGVDAYSLSFDEMSAEQFVKYVTSKALNGVLNIKLPKAVLAGLTKAIEKVKEMLGVAKAERIIPAEKAFSDMFDWILERRHQENARLMGVSPEQIDARVNAVDDLGTQIGIASHALRPEADITNEFGLDGIPDDTPLQRAEKKQIINLFRQATNPEAPWNNIPPDQLQRLFDKSATLSDAVKSTSLKMLQSEHPVVRMVATILLEDPSGAAGRRTTAAITKFLSERSFMGNSVNEVQDAYKLWRNQHGGSLWKDVVSSKYWDEFNGHVADYIETVRRGGDTQGAHPAVVQAAASLEAAYERMAFAQKSAKVPGWGALPATSKGYMPHMMDPVRVRNMTPDQARGLRGILAHQFETIEGWDPDFSSQLAKRYVDRVRGRALNEYEASVSIHETGAATIVEEALQAMGLTESEVRAQLEKFMRGAQGHLKKRIELDLSQALDDTTTLKDFFVTDQLRLLRRQAGQASGAVALASNGVMGRPGLKLLRRAMGYGGKLKDVELEAFDQVAAEFMNDPFGTADSKWANRVMTLTSVTRLGGMGITQAAEFINMIWHVGAAKTLSAVGDLGRLRSEILRLAKGEVVENPIIGSLEAFGGAQFGVDHYKLVFPFDDPNAAYAGMGANSHSTLDRALRGMSHLSAKASLWRAVHATQVRGAAEQIVLRALEYIHAGKEDKALASMGFHSSLVQEIRAELGHAAEFQNGKLVRFDINKMKNTAAAFEFTQAVHRGSQQIIQGTFIGETGKWAHHGYLKLLTQFRTFSLVSVEKQWARQKNAHGPAKALGMMLGSMSVAAPIYMMRMYGQAALLPRGKREEYLDRVLSPAQIARASMNYISMAGLLPEFIDAVAGIGGFQLQGGPKYAGSSSLVEQIIPAAGLIDSVARSAGQLRDKGNIQPMLKNLPFSRLPYLIPAVNALTPEE